MKHVKDDQREQNRLQKLIKKLSQKPHVAVGVLQDEEVSPGFTIVDLATVHEYGSKNGRIPARSFMRTTCDAKQKVHLALIEKLHGRLLDGKATIQQALALLGEVVSKDMVQTFNRGIEPELKPATVKRKKSSKPLIDTGRLKGAITHEVRGS